MMEMASVVVLLPVVDLLLLQQSAHGRQHATHARKHPHPTYFYMYMYLIYVVP